MWIFELRLVIGLKNAIGKHVRNWEISFASDLRFRSSVEVTSHVLILVHTKFQLFPTFVVDISRHSLQWGFPGSQIEWMA
jgi:hypothetical protein